MVVCGNNKMKVIQKNDYKSVALPVELQGHRLFCRINSLFNQVIQHKINLYPARSCCCSQSFVPQCGSIVTNLSVYYRHENPIRSGISQSSFSSLKQIKMEWKKYESNQVLK